MIGCDDGVSRAGRGQAGGPEWAPLGLADDKSAASADRLDDVRLREDADRATNRHTGDTVHLLEFGLTRDPAAEYARLDEHADIVGDLFLQAFGPLISANHVLTVGEAHASEVRRLIPALDIVRRINTYYNDSIDQGRYRVISRKRYVELVRGSP